MRFSKMMSWAVCGFVVSFLFADFASAQRGGRGGRGGVTRYQLATLTEVQGELKLTDAQKKAATDAVAKATEEQAALRGGGGDPAETRAKLAKVQADLTEKFVATLDDTQKTRIHGLFVQANTANSLTSVFQDAMIAKALAVTEDQTKAINKAVADIQTAIQGAAGDQDAMAKARTDGDAVLMKILTADQTKKLADLKGKDLPMDMSSLRGGRGGGRRGAGA